MQMAIRALGWATKLLWIIVLAIIITIAYSATQVSIAFGEPTTTVTGQTVAISLPISVRNAGLYDLTQLNVTTRITDQYGHSLVEDSTLIPIISRGTNTTMMHTTALNVTKILDQNSDLIFNDTTLTAFQYVAFSYANAILLSAYANQTMPWGAPLSKLMISNLSNLIFTPYNATHSIVTVQLCFENHNQYVPVTGTARIEIYSTHNVLEGAGMADINAPPYTSCSTQVDVLVSNLQTLSPEGEVHVLFEVSAFNFGPVVMPFG
jgi:hypothetical protein